MHYNMMTSSNGNIFRVIGLCAGNSPVTKNREAGDFRRHRVHYDFTVIIWSEVLSVSLLLVCEGWEPGGTEQSIMSHVRMWSVSMGFSFASLSKLRTKASYYQCPYRTVWFQGKVVMLSIVFLRFHHLFADLPHGCLSGNEPSIVYDSKYSTISY